MTSMPPTDPETFRQLLGAFATGVTVATTVTDDGAPAGMTVSAVSAVSLEPPLLLICVNRSAKFHAALGGCRAFALNVLAADQSALSEEFARGEGDPFAAVPHHPGRHDVPLVDGVAAHILCTPWGAYEAGDHTVFFGVVIDGQTFDRHPLVHHRGQYSSLDNSG